MSDSDEINESDIAIVGMACRFPGADTPAEYWDNLRNGVESISFFTEDELLAEGESPARLRQPNYVPAAGAMSDMEMFDGEFFGFSPKESAILDPQHRHFLEVSWEALEDAAHPPERFDGPIGVYAGCGMGSYFYFNLCSNPALVNDVGMFLLRHTGNDKDFLATRVSYLFNLSGPAVNVQTACSTSLVAVHLACQSLLGREIDMAIAGGVTIEIPHRRGYLYHEGEVLSPDGHCHAFDHRGQGTVFGSGAGAVVLRRLEDAIEDRDHIYAVIRSSAINNDGSRKVGYLAPSVDGQAAAMVEAHELGEVAADTIGYVECHGTGTAMGDPIEVSALTQAFRQSTDKKQFCRIGSVKTNIGHLDTAAGVASLIKAALALHHGELPPTLNFEKPNPSIEFAESPFIVNDALTPWPRNSAPRRAAVNSLGVGGTNAHAVLEEAPLRNVPDSKEDSFQLLCFSGKSGAALDAYQKRLLAHLESADVSLADVAFTLAEGRQAFSRRRVLAVRTKDEAIALLREPDPRRVFTHTAVDGEASLAFMFPGGGSQYPAMGRGLYESEPVYRNALDRGLRLLQDKTGEDYRRFFFPDAPDELNEELALMRYQLPTIFLTEYALAQLWMDRGLRPAALIGHSMGENTAACIAGVISFEDCLSLVLLRGQLMDKSEPGAMLSISLPANQVEELMGPELELSIINGPELACVSGPAGPIEALEEQLAEQEIEAQRLRIPIAAHSRLLDSMLPEFRAFLESIPLRAPTIPFVSNLTGTWIRDDEARSPEYWTKHVRQTVRFADGVGVLLEEPNRVLLEVGPGRTLTSLARSHPRAMPSLNAVGSLRHRDEDVDDRTYLGSMFGRLWAAGAVSDLSPLFDEDRQRVSLPTYAFQHQPYFIEPGQHAPMAEAEAARIDRVEDWGSEPFWTRHYPELGTTEAHTWLFFMDDLGVGESLARRLQDRGDNVVRVFPGDAYGRKSPTAFTLSPERGAEGYETLIRELVQSGYAPDRIVHGWLLTAAETFRPGSSFFHRNLERGFYSLFFLGKALQDDSVPRPLHLTVLTNGMQQVRDEALPYPEKATVLGPARVIPRELPGITCRTLDVQLPEARAELFGGRLRMALADPFAGKRTVTEELERLSDSLFEELQAEPGNGVAAYRGDKRYALRYRPVPLATPDAPGLRDGMTLLITGGLGGLGLVMAEHCANVAKVNLVLVGRRGLPPRDTWDEWLKTHSPEEVTARRIRMVQNLEFLGAEVLIGEADVTNLEQMSRVVDEARQRFRTIDGVLHTAGVVDDNLLALKTQADVEQVFAPKIHGTQILDQLLGEDRAFHILFSSTSTATAPAGQVDYVAANAFLNAFATSHRERGKNITAVNWGIWSQVGMAAEAFGPEGTKAAPETVAYPLFDERYRDERGRQVLTMPLTTEAWLLDEHRTLAGHALVPGTGYIELVHAALRASNEAGAYEVRDLYFIRPLQVDDGSDVEAQVRLNETERGFGIEVRSRVEVDGVEGTQLHAMAQVSLAPFDPPKPIDLEAVRARATRVDRDDSGIRSPQEKHLRFGPRWRVLRAAHYGSDEALGEVELSASFVSDLDDFELHPAMLDYATGFAMELIEGYEAANIWVPVSYDRIRVSGRLPQKVYAWVRSDQNRADTGFATFDVTLADGDGRVLVDIEGFSIKKIEGDVDFAVAGKPSLSDVELTADAQPLSPAELQLKRNLEQGIRPSEGGDALLRLLRPDTPPVVVVSSIALEELVRQADQSLVSPDEGTKFARPNLDSEFVEARNDIERTLVGFWEELLGVDQVGIRDSFFDLGGHSLIAVRLFSKIKKAYQTDFPISVLFEAPTIEACAALIEGEIGTPDAAEKKAEPRRRYTHLVSMHPGEGGEKTPFFLVAGMFGNVLNLRHLAHLLGGERRFYGLQALGLYGDQQPHETFEEMAAAYIAELRTVQEKGPYLLGGFSGGGITALEMAQQLKGAGEEVGLLVMLDTPVPVRPGLTPSDRVKVQLQRLRDRGPGYVGEWAKNRWAWEVGKLRARFEEPETRGEGEFHNEAIEAAFRRALDHYALQSYDGRITLFRPRLDEHYVLGEDRILSQEMEWQWHDNGWTPHASEVMVHEVPGNHDSMVLEPNVRVLAESLRQAIDDAETRAPEHKATVVSSGEARPADSV